MSNNQLFGYVSLLYSIANRPLDLWSKHVPLGGRIRRVQDDMLHGDKVIEIVGPHDSAVPANITVPAKIMDVLNIKLPVLALVIKNLNLRFKLEIQIIDKEQYRRRFSFLTYNLEKLPNVDVSIARIPLKLEEYWNLLEINLQTLCCKTYGIDYEALQRIIVYPNCRLRRIYLQDRHYDHNETPIEIYQAFFDMYMLKRGINFIETACQTEEYRTDFTRGSLEQRNLNNFVENNEVAISLTENNLSGKMCNTEKLEKLNTFDTMINSYDSSILKRKQMSLGVLCDKIKLHTNQNVIKNQCHIKSANNLATENNGNIIEKKEKQNAVEKYMTRNPNFMINVKLNNCMLKPMTSVQLTRIGRSQFLKTHVDETLFKGNEFPKRPHSHRIRNSRNTYVTSKNCILNNSSNNINNINSVGAKLKKSVNNFPPTSKYDLSENFKFNHDQMSNNLINIQTHITSKDRHIKEEDKIIINDLKSLDNVKESTENICISTLIEEVNLNNTKSQCTYLAADKTISDFKTACHSVNKQFFEKLQSKGIIMPQIELLTHNATNQANSYAQEKFIEKQRWCRDKCIGL